VPEIRALREEEIECRVSRVNEHGVTLLLYKDARCDMAILDEMFTPLGWKREHSFFNNKEYCTVSVKGSDGDWISKMDCGTESNTEKEKGQSSDAFKRACVNWGIGRELYTKIDIFFYTQTEKTPKNTYILKNKRARYSVSKIHVDEKTRKIDYLEIVNEAKNRVFEWKDGKTVFQTENAKQSKEPKESDMPKNKPETQPDAMEYVCSDCGEVITVKGEAAKDKYYTAQESINLIRSLSNDGNMYCKKCRPNHKKVM